MTLLRQWFDQQRSVLESWWGKVEYAEHGYVSGGHVTLDRHDVLAGISHWAPSRFEFQVGPLARDELLIEEHDLFDPSEITAHLERMVRYVLETPR